ncbi:MAG: hypothetical protein HOW73_35475 [Polyangiaceae bacterium]|nr:hypothetical protein [Polyangiaceae bacterium]
MAVVVGVVTVLRPFWAATYPPMTDLPFHAAQTSIFRHYFDPSYHFREQFEITPLAVPYVSSYLLGALFMLVLPAVPAVKAATAVMLLAVPGGLAVLAWGMRKSPILGMLGLPFVWCNLTHWGFINHMAALGIFAAVLGLTLRVLEEPTRRLQIALGGALVLLFFTHVFRFPYAVASMGIATVLFYRRTKRIRPIVIAALPSLVLFSIFWFVRPKAVSGGVTLTFEWARREKLFDYVIGTFADPAEAQVAKLHLVMVVMFAVVAAALHFATRPRTERSARETSFAWLATAAVGGALVVMLVGYFVLPMEIGIWWYVFPREATSVLYLAMALVPDLPRSIWAKGVAVAAFSWSAWSASTVVARNYEVFDRATRDFSRIIESIPQGPRLLYLVMDHSGSTRLQTPFIHLPAYVQAERGGFLSFHFAMWDASPARYRRDPDATVPPPVPLRWEWQPSQFRVERHGPFFNWFLVRSRSDPGRLFGRDPSIEEVRHEGTWWLYRRTERH